MVSAGAEFVPSRDLPSVHGRGGSRKDKMVLIEEGLGHIAKALGALEGEEEHFWVDQDRHGQGEGEGGGGGEETDEEDDYELRFTKDWLMGVTCLRWLPLREGANEEDKEMDDDGDEERTEEILRQAARLVAVCAGKSASGKSRRVYHLLADTDADRRDVAVRLEEQVLVEDALGARTWGAAPLLASLLLQKHLKHVVQRRPSHSSGVRVLELGAGTGLVGLAVAQFFRQVHTKQAQVYLTDYHPDVLRNLRRNVELNECASSPAQPVQITVSALDWNDTPVKDFGGPFDLVVAADCVYEAEHAGLVKRMAEQYLSRQEQAKLLLLSPLRPTHEDEIQRIAHEFPTCPSTSRPTTAITPLRLCITHQEDLLGHDNFGPPALQLTAQTVRLGGRSMRETGFRAYTIQWCAV